MCVISFYCWCCFHSSVWSFSCGMNLSFRVLLSLKCWAFHLKSGLVCGFLSRSGKRKALKLNFANPPIKPTTRFTLNTAGPPFQNPHMWVKPSQMITRSFKINPHSDFLKSFCFFYQREAENAQHRVVGKVEDLPGAALGFHGRGSQRFGRDRPRGLWLRQQDGAQAE